MKKRLLITSIVMMLVVAVALSTATYAWFTSNDTVSASTVTLTAESNGGAALGIGWVDGTTGTTITANAAASYNPMVPNALVVDNGSNTPTNFSAVTWSGATTRTVGGVPVFNAPYNPAPAPYQFNGTVSGNAKYVFYLENLSASNDINSITMSLSNVTDANDLLRVAVFTSDSATGTFALRAVLSKTNAQDTEWGTVQTDGVVADLCSTPVATTTSYVIDGLEAGDQLFFKVVVWLDGAALIDEYAETSTIVGLSFVAA